MDIYKKFFQKYTFLIILFALIGGVIGLITTRLIPQTYDVSLALNVERVQNNTTDFYTYDGYYAIQSTELFSKNVASWFITPDFVEDVLKNSEKSNIDDISVKDFRRFFTPEQISSNIVEVRFGVEDIEDGNTLTEAINLSIEAYIQTREIQNYTIRVGDPVIRPKVYNPLFFSLGGLILGLTLAVVGATLKEYFWK